MVRYWLPVMVWLALMFLGSTDMLSAAQTSRIIGPLLRWFKPDISAEAIAQVQFIVRKAAHLTEYAILAALLWRAIRLGTMWRWKMWILFVVVSVSCASSPPATSFINRLLHRGLLRRKTC